MGITILVLAIIAIIVGVSVKEYLQNKQIEEEAKSAIENRDLLPQAPYIIEEPLALNNNDVKELLIEVENIVPQIEEPKKTQKRKYYKPKSKKQNKKQNKDKSWQK